MNNKKIADRISIMMLSVIILCAIIVGFIIIVYDQNDYAYQEAIFKPQLTGTYKNLSTDVSGEYRFGDAIVNQAGDKIVIQGQFDRLPQQGEYLFLFFVHAKLKVFVGEQLIYSFGVEDPVADYLKTPGNIWHKIPIPPKTQSEDIIFEFETVRSNYPFRIMDAQISQTMGMFNEVKQKNIVTFVISIFIIFVGVTIVLFSVLFAMAKYPAGHFAFIGITAILGGLWFVCENKIVYFFGASPPFVYFLCLVSLYFLPLPLLKYCLYAFDLKLKKYLEAVFDLILTFGCIALVFQLLGIVPLYDFLKTAQFFLLLASTSIFIVFLYEYGKTKNKEVLYFGLKFFLLAFCGILELVSYYLGIGEISHIFLIGILIFFILQFFDISKYLLELAATSSQATLYRQLATKDQLTGIRNRTSYTEMIRVYNSQLSIDSIIGVGVFDLNNLKGINDSYGHTAGDEYIKNCSQIICKTFSNSPVFRIGGDEFAVILIDMQPQTVEEFYQDMVIKMNEYNKNATLKIGIAFGYAHYDPIMDHSLEDVFAKADSNMYENKKIIKASY